MKTSITFPRAQEGNTLLVTIFVTGLLSFTLASYLTLVQSQGQANARSQSWNSAIPILEAGLEEALAHLNVSGKDGGTLAVDGWGQSGNDFVISRTLGGSVYTVTIKDYVVGNQINSPVIESVGYVEMPLVLVSANNILLASAGGDPSANYLGRGVRVQALQDRIFTKGMVARDSIDMNGNNIRTDSFDSSNPLYSSNGLYHPSMARDNGDVAVNSSLTNSLSVGNADIYGHVSVGPGGTIAVGNNGAVGSTSWHASGSGGIEPGWSANDMNVSFPDVEAPFTGGAFVPSGGWVTNTTSTVSTSTNSSTTYGYPVGCLGSISSNVISSSTYPVGHPGPITTNWNGTGSKITGYVYSTFTCSVATESTNTTTTSTYYDYILDDGNYQAANLNGTVYVRGDAVLYVTDALDVTSLVIHPGESLQLYSAAASSSIAGNNTINSDGLAQNFSYWGLPSNTSVTFSGNSAFTGTIYAPNADFTLNAGGNNIIDFIGASITKTVTLNGHFNFHYDEALRGTGPFRGWIVSSWNEMSPSDIPPLTYNP
jgi:hypothetical protein